MRRQFDHGARPRDARAGRLWYESGVRPVALLVLWAAFARPAVADEKEIILSASPDFAFIHLDGHTAWGGGGAVDVSYGLTDALAVRATGAFTAHGIGRTDVAPAGSVLAYHAGVGVTYAIDIVRVVPSLDFSLGLLGVRRPTSYGDQYTNQFGVEIGLGVDYLLSRRIAIGVVARYHAFLTAITELPAYFYAGPRVSFHFGG